MIFHQYKAIFFHVGKAAGTSVESLLLGEDVFNKIITSPNISDYRPDIIFGSKHGIWMQHAVPFMIKKEVTPEIWDSYYKFSIVRNPFKRMLSVYWYNIEQHKKNYGSFSGFVKALPELVINEQAVKGDHYTPQVCHTSINGLNVCDEIIKMEDLPNAFNPVIEKLNLNSSLPNKNSVSKDLRIKHQITLQNAYSNDLDKIITEVYAEDFERFGYCKNINKYQKLSNTILKNY